MAKKDSVLEYKCPCCNAGLVFQQEEQNLHCNYCGNSFEFETVREYNEAGSISDSEKFSWDQADTAKWDASDKENVHTFTCPACGGVLMTDDQTAATFCPYCDNPAVLPGRLSGGLKPDFVLPFRKTKEDAQNAFRKLCSKKLLLPKDFVSDQRIEKITGIYVPFWLCSCDADQQGKYHATRVRHWSDSNYNYTRTDHYLLTRSAKASFERIPLDGSSKMDDAIMESIEPFDYRFMTDFDTAYLTGFFADKYDVEASAGEGRIRQRVSQSMDEMIAPSMVGYATTIPQGISRSVKHSKAQYVLLPVWMLCSKYKDKTYLFAMNGQSGKMTGSFPICPKKSAIWFAGVCAAVAAIVTLIQYLCL